MGCIMKGSKYIQGGGEEGGNVLKPTVYHT